MIKSMTGFGKSEMVFSDKKILIEIKTLNSKNTDISVKTINGYRNREMEIRQLASERLERGKIDISLSVELNEGATTAFINAPAFKSYYTQIASLMEELNLQAGESLISSILRLPDAIKTDRGVPEEKEWVEILNLLNSAIDEVNLFRLQEGKILENEVIKRIYIILQKLDEVKPFEKSRIELVKQRILNSLNELNLPEEPDKNRFEQEMIYYLEKLDITEEKVRLRNHCNYFIETIRIGDSPGKKLAFITQEIGREINTLGSKAYDSEIQKRVVEMKDELEKIKEQILNVL